MNNFKPMLAATLLPSGVESTDDNVLAAMKLLRYPVMATVKMDGIRALRMEMPILASRTLKWIPNEELCARALSIPIGYDMELWSPKLNYNEIESIVMTEKCDSSMIEFHVLDIWNRKITYKEACHNIFIYETEFTSHDVKFNYPHQCNSPEELFAFEQDCIQKHSEGICFRTGHSPYKQGRSTLREQYLVKHCRWIYEECVIIGFTEQMENSNREKRNATGKMDRSKSISGMLPKDTLGSFLVKNRNGVCFNVATGEGLTEKLRQEIWNKREYYLHDKIVVKSKAHGALNKPRSPIFWGFREKGF